MLEVCFQIWNAFFSLTEFSGYCGAVTTPKNPQVPCYFASYENRTCYLIGVYCLATDWLRYRIGKRRIDRRGWTVMMHDGIFSSGHVL